MLGKRITKNFFTKKAFISYFQISVLVIALFAFSYMINELFDKEKGKFIIEEENNKSFSLFGRINKISDLFNNEIIPLIDAVVEGCCEVTKNGNTCQTASIDNCNENYQSSPTSCEFTNYCKLGCCVSSTTGICNERTSKIDCERSGGIFKDGESCNIQECQRGCCLVGDEAIWTTEKNCQWEGNTQNRDLPTNWNQNIESELQCLFLAEKNRNGACIFDSDGERKCALTSLDECFKRTGSEANFAADKFCSDRLLNTTCRARDHKGCVFGEEDVYWFDSCNNKESVADNCDLYRGSYCGKELGSFSCRDIRCDTDGDGIKDRENGESWCEYDAAIGDGKDTAGSRHVKHICYRGDERIAPCADFRQEICVQENANVNAGGFSQAACRVNRWRECLDYNKLKDGLKGKCQENIDCRLKHIDMDGSFKFDVCLPKYPPGFDLIPDNLYDENGSLNEENYYSASPGDAICDIATHQCTETWLVGIFCPGCVDNCDCSTEKFTKEMNDFCVSLGDCGASINYIGEHSSDGYSVKGAPFLSSEEMGFSRYANVISEPATPGEYAFFETLNPELLPVANREAGNLSAFEQELSAASGAYGSPLLLEILKQNADNATSVEGLAGLSLGIIGYSRFTGGVSSAKAGILAQIVDPDEKGSQQKDFSMIASMIAGLIAALIGGMIGALIGALLGALLGMLGGGCVVVKKQINFNCFQWQPPGGGDKCNECNKLEVPCTEYRCESLGQSCQLINKGSGNELCINKASNESFPLINPFQTVISTGYKYHNVNKDGFEVVNSTGNGCLEPYTSVDIGIKVEPFARCRIGTDPEQSYEEMTDTFGPKGNYVLPAHLTKLFFPSPEAFKNIYNLSEEQIRQLGKNDLYVKCKTAGGKVNLQPYKIKSCIRPGPDLTPPRVSVTFPLSGSFLAHNTTQKEVVIFVNEPSECKFSLADKEFNAMENQLTCETNPLAYGLYGLPCNVTLPTSNNNKFYFRCKDLSENRNVMAESYVFEFKNSASSLLIDEIIPRNNEKIISSIEPVGVKLKIRTSGGAKSGESICRWEGNGIYGDYFSYSNSNGSKVHEYQLTSLVQGEHEIKFICEDIAGNKAENSTRFEIKIDKFGPKITRIYYDNGLKTITSEKSECRYSFARDFVFENATRMGSDGISHFAGWMGKTYYLQCKDSLGNKGERIKIKPY